jgi:glycosyltransferase involved in cell wall biosynthesis
MRIVMMTNTFTPHVGGVARSVEAFTASYRKLGHRVLVVAPEFDNMPGEETDVVRIPAIQNFNGSDFSVVLPAPGFLRSAVEVFRPEIVHSHHPFLIGSTALRLARQLSLPIVFTHHTMYEQYTHYVPGDSETLKRFVINLSTRYANLCDHVFAPSASIASVLRRREVVVPIDVVPTGVSLGLMSRGDGAGFRAVMGISEDAFVVGHVGRLAPEKNLDFLTDAVVAFLKSNPRACFLMVGWGPSKTPLRRAFQRAGLADRLYETGVLSHPILASAYQAMDLFAFASKSETQGMVLTEANAAGVPVVALDAPGVREVVVDGENGRLLEEETVEAFSSAFRWLAEMTPERRIELRRAAKKAAERISLETTAQKALSIYEAMIERGISGSAEDDMVLSGTLNLIKAEWDLLMGLAGAAGAALTSDEEGADAPT